MARKISRMSVRKWSDLVQEKLPQGFVEYRDKRNSSGKIRDGVIHLSISSRLSPAEQEVHIKKLTEKLLAKLHWAQQYDFSWGEGPVKTDQDLMRLADTINRAYYNYPFRQISFHEQKTTWGTCSGKTRQIYISARLIGAPLEFLWYVVTHELCHLAEPRHNQRFWNLVSKACPNYQECRRRLKAFGLQLVGLPNSLPGGMPLEKDHVSI